MGRLSQRNGGNSPCAGSRSSAVCSMVCPADAIPHCGQVPVMRAPDMYGAFSTRITCQRLSRQGPSKATNSGSDKGAPASQARRAVRPTGNSETSDAGQRWSIA